MTPDDLRFSPRDFEVPTGRGPVRVSWLGTAGFSLEHEGYTVLIDPYLTRASLPALLASPARSDPAAVSAWAPRADAIVAGHTHFDHVLDVPAIARATGATVYGSRSCATLCRAEGVDAARVVDVESTSRREAEVGPFSLRFVPSAHSTLALGRVPFPGEIDDCDRVPFRAHRYRCGAVFGVEVRVGRRTIYHLGSANLLDAAVPRDVDLLLMCVAGWTATDRFTDRVMRAASPRAIVLSHWDDFFRPLSSPARMLPAMQLPRLVEGLTRVDPGVRIGALPLFGAVSL